MTRTTLRLLYVIPGLDPGGGTERSLLELVPTLVDGGIDVSIAYMKKEHGESEEQLRRPGVRLHHIAARYLPARVSGVRRAITMEQPDIVHTSLYEADVAGRLAARRRRGRSPLVLTSLVNMSYDPARLADPNVSAGKLRAVRLLDGWTARHLTDHFHAVSHAVKESAVRWLGIDPGQVTVIERGRDPVRLGEPTRQRRARGRTALAIDAEALVVVTVGRQEFQKGQVHLVRAFASVATRRRDAHLVLVGRPGSQSAEIEGLVRCSPGRDRIHRLGHRDDVPELLAAADVFVLPSIYEGFPGAVIEAMALGLPVVASHLPPLRELVEEDRSGLLVPPGDADRLEATLGALLDDPASRHRLGARARELYLERFTAEQSHRRMADLYRALVAT